MEWLVVTVLLGYVIFGFIVCRKNSPADCGRDFLALKGNSEEAEIFPLYFVSADNLPDEFWAVEELEHK